ncbi:DUF6382 domain-containing protein [Paenibacillus humicus]|uniref:DUF6382 domain-containing protein n=1 Tax=Paenibacillus humicus TaxID=412861 RepID=UPI003D279750
MKGIVTDFVRNDGTYMVVNTEDGLHAEQLNVVQRNMVNSVAIPHLLRLEVREIDFKVTLHYEITGKRMLSQCLKSEWMTMTEFYSILLQIVKVLNSSKEYMLSSGNYLLDEDHIFVEDSLPSGTIYLAYLPMLHTPPDQSIAQSMLHLVNRMMTRVKNIEGSGIQKIIGLCGGEQFSVTGLKNLLISLLLEEDSSEGQGSNVHIRDTGRRPRELDAPEVPMPPNSKNTSQVPFAAPEPSSSLIPSRINAMSSASIYEGAFMEEEGGIYEEEAESRTEIKPAYIWLGAALLVALIWKLAYLDGSAGNGLYISAGSSLAVIFIALLIQSGKFDLVRFFRDKGNEEGDFQIEDNVRLAGEEEHEKSRFTKRRKPERYEEKWRWNAPSPSIAPSANRPSESKEPIQTPVSKPYQELVEAQPPAAASPATVLLKDISKEEQPQAGSVSYLEKITSSGAGFERILLSKGSFIIGRSEELAQYVEKEAGVSRAHVELMILEGDCRIKDLGSRNGTKLNGELIAPYKDYPIEPGDSFTMAEVTFRYGREIQNSA